LVPRRLDAAERDVTVVGRASIIQQVVRAGLFDELLVDVMPVLLGGGVTGWEGVFAV